MAPAGLGHAGPAAAEQLPEEYKEEISPDPIVPRSHSHAIIRRTSRSGLSIASIEEEEEPGPAADPAHPSRWRHLADRVMRRSRSQGEPIASLGADDNDPADPFVASKPASSLASFLEAYDAKQQQQQQQQQQQLRSGLVTPATVPVTEPTSPQVILGPDGQEIVTGMRRKKSVTERAQKATWRCAHLIKPCVQILLCLAAAATVFYFITEIEGIRMIDVSVIALPFGEVRGKITKDYQEYLGVPFALPPQRFGVPHLWKGRYPNGFLDATIPAEPCAQIVGNRVFGSEDCLRLNIFSPAPSASLPAAAAAHRDSHDAGYAEARPAAAGHHRRSLLRGRRLSGGGGGGGEAEEGGHEVIVPPRPVMVYFHGGGFAAGSADEVDGRRLAADNNVIVVSVPYRLGALGFLAHPDMLKGDGFNETREGIGNLGLLDQRAALLWIQEHIQAFNGDPARVTVFGHGAGATSACLQAVLPPGEEQGGAGERGLAQAAIVESGACYAQPLDMALKRGEEFAAAASCSTLACLEALPLPDLLRASRDVSAPRFRFWQPVVDGQVVPLPANQLLAQAQELSLIAGDNTDEGDNFARSALQHAHEADEDYVAYVKGPMRAMEGLELLTDAEVEELLALYPPAGSRAAGLAAEHHQQQQAQEQQQQQQQHEPEAPLHAEPAAVKAGGDAGSAAAAQQGEKEAGDAASPTARLTGNRLNIAQIMSDAHYYCPTLAAARALPNQDQAFVYSFRYAPQPCPGRAGAGGMPLGTYKGGDRESAESYGSTPAAYDTGLRAAEVPFVFHDRVRGDCRRAFTKEEDLLAEEMEGYWTTLARSTTTPNPDPKSQQQQQQQQPQPHAVPLGPIAGPGAEPPAVHGEEQPHVIVAAPPAPAAAPGPAHRGLRSLGELFSHRKDAKEEEGGPAWERHRSSQDGAVPLSFWPALGQGEKALVFEDGGVAIRPPERLAFCAFWDRTKVYMA